MPSDESAVDDKGLEANKGMSQRIDRGKIVELNKVDEDIYYEIIESNQENTASTLKELFNENEAFRDKEHFVHFAEEVCRLKFSSIGTFISASDSRRCLYNFSIEPIDAPACMASALEHAAAFQKKYDRYKELLGEGEKKIDEIMSAGLLDEYPPNINSVFRMKYDRYQKLLEEGKIEDDNKNRSVENLPKSDHIDLPFDYEKIKVIKEYVCLLYFKEALQKYFSIEESSFIESGINGSLNEQFLSDKNPFGQTPSYLLARDLLQKEEIALKVARSVYPLEEKYKVSEGAYVEDLPYILYEISPKYKNQLEHLRCLKERFEETKEIIENAIKCGSLLTVSEGKDFVKYEKLALWIQSNRDNDPTFPIYVSKWLAAKAGEKLNYKELYEKTKEELRKLKEAFEALQAQEEMNPKNKCSWALMMAAFMEKCGLPKETFLKVPDHFFTTKINDKTLVNWVSEIYLADGETIKAMLEDIRKYIHNKHKKPYQSVKEFKKSASKK